MFIAAVDGVVDVYILWAWREEFKNFLSLTYYKNTIFKHVNFMYNLL